MNRKLIITIITLVVLSILGYFMATTICGCTERCKHENAECAINESGMPCCEGLECVPFNEHSENGKCLPIEPTPTPQIRPTATPSATPTNTPTPRPEPGPKGPPEWEDPCFYLRDHEECKPKEEIFPGEGEVFGPIK